MNHGLTLKLFLVDGAPTGLITAEIMNWTGHVITGPRSDLPELVRREEAARTGIYFLIGPDGSGLGTAVYIGETDEIAQRLTAHNRPEEKGGKDFWERFCIVTSKDANLTKSHAKFLESRLIRVALSAKRCRLINATDPGYASLPEADRSDMEFFLDQIRTLMPVLGFNFLRETPTTSPTAQRTTSESFPDQLSASPIFVGDLKKYNVTARAREADGEFIVLQGSKTRAKWESSQHPYKTLFEYLVANGTLVPTPDDQHMMFTRDYAFSSPSAAAAVVTGRQANGRTHWIDPNTGMTYGAWLEAKVNQTLANSKTP